MKILAVIPCRSGSKSIKNKNIVKLFGHPLVAYTIRFAKKCKFISKIIISTDSQKYAKISKKYGCSPLFIRPKKISKDNSLDIDVFLHAIKWLKKKENFVPDYVINLRPTSPLRSISDLKKIIKILKKNSNIDSVRSISECNFNLYKTWFINSKRLLLNLTKNITKFKEPHNSPRQYLPKTYVQTAVYDVVKTDIILKQKKMSGKRIYGFITKDFIDIDNHNDLKSISHFQQKKLLKIIK